MANTQGAGGFLSGLIQNKNHVPEMIKAVAAAKRSGLYTFQVGKYVCVSFV
jgi:hypothetical protein